MATSTTTAATTTALPPTAQTILAKLHLPAYSDKFIAGFVSGLVVAGLFNPWDRALYLSVVHERPFLSKENFVHPYKGFYQSLFNRTLSSGLYFPLFDLFEPIYTRQFQHSHPMLIHFLAGNSAGAISGIVLNQFTAIKYASWDAEHGFVRTAKQMWREGGIKPFMKGIVPTVIRDTVFGGVFAITKEGTARLIKHYNTVPAAGGVTSNSPESPYQSHRVSINPNIADFLSSMVAGALGTIVSSPFNYVRNIKYGWPAADQPPSTGNILGQLYSEVKIRSRENGIGSGLSHVQDRLRIGWGTARVAVGMAVGYEIYTLVKNYFETTSKAQSESSGNAANSQ